MRLITSISFIALISGCDRDIHDHPTDITGEQLFEYHCSTCHQSTGKGRFLKGIPANKATGLSKEQISHKITSSNDPNSKMPGFPNMPTEESEKIAAYVKSL